MKKLIIALILMSACQPKSDKEQMKEAVREVLDSAIEGNQSINSKTPLEATIKEITNEFKADSAAAIKKYNNSEIKVSGVVNEVYETDNGRRVNVTLHGDGYDLIAAFAKSANKNAAVIKTGNKIIFNGLFIGVEVDDIMPDMPPMIRMDKCILIQ